MSHNSLDATQKKTDTLLTDACLVERSQLSSLMSRISHRLGTWRAKTAAKLSHAFCFLVEPYYRSIFGLLPASVYDPAHVG
jgi:hypothetical protein